MCHNLKPLSGKCRCRKHGPDYNPGPGGNYSGNILIDLDCLNNILSGCHQHNTVYWTQYYHNLLSLSNSPGVGSTEKSSQRTLGRGRAESRAPQVSVCFNLGSISIIIWVTNYLSCFRGETVTVGQHRRLELRLREFER